MARGSKHSIRFDGRPKIVLSGLRPLQHFRTWQRYAEIDLKSLQAIDVDNGAFASTINGGFALNGMMQHQAPATWKSSITIEERNAPNTHSSR